MTVNPAINLFGGNFGTNVRYILNVDTQRRQQSRTLAYVTRFGAYRTATGNQSTRS